MEMKLKVEHKVKNELFMALRLSWVLEEGEKIEKVVFASIDEDEEVTEHEGDIYNIQGGIIKLSNKFGNDKKCKYVGASIYTSKFGKDYDIGGIYQLQRF